LAPPGELGDLAAEQLLTGMEVGIDQPGQQDASVGVQRSARLEDPARFGRVAYP
jgi:hypothetical protein